MDYNDKKFRPIANTTNAETSTETIFHYKQEGNIVTAYYNGGKIKKGHLIGKVDENGAIDMRYHQVNMDGELMTGVCFSKPELDGHGKIKLHERWEWTSGDFSRGTSVLIEI